MTHATYLEDGVYAQLDNDGELVLTVGCHYDSTDNRVVSAIYMDRHVVGKLLEYIAIHGLDKP